MVSWLMDCLHRDLYQKARSTFVVLFTFSGLLAVGVLPAGAGNYHGSGRCFLRDSVKLVPIFMVSCVFALVTSQYVFIHTFHGHVFHCGLLTMGVAALNVAACWLLTPIYGYGVVGYVNVIAYGLLYLAHIGLLKYRGIRDFMPTRYIFVGALLPCGFGTGDNLLGGTGDVHSAICFLRFCTNRNNVSVITLCEGNAAKVLMKQSIYEVHSRFVILTLLI